MPGLGAPVRNGRETRTTLSVPAPRNASGWCRRFFGLARWVARRHERRSWAFRLPRRSGVKGETDAAKREPRSRMVSTNGRPGEARDEPGNARSLLSAVPVVRARRRTVRHGRRRAMEGGPSEVNRTACFDGRFLFGSEAGDETAPRICRSGRELAVPRRVSRKRT